MNAALRICPTTGSILSQTPEILNAVFICRGKEARSSFLKKRSKRLLQIQIRVPPERSATASEKSLLVLFYRKEHFLPSPPFLKVQS